MDCHETFQNVKFSVCSPEMVVWCTEPCIEDPEIDAECKCMVVNSKENCYTCPPGQTFQDENSTTCVDLPRTECEEDYNNLCINFCRNVPRVNELLLNECKCMVVGLDDKCFTCEEGLSHISNYRVKL